MNLETKITSLFNIKYPIIQAGMVWVSGWKLASAVSNNGALGLIGAGSMKPDLLKEHIFKCKAATNKPFGVNIPLLREDSDVLVNISIEEGVKIFFTSAGSPAKHISLLKRHNCTVVHVVPSVKFALKAEKAGCDAVVGEGVEAGGHNGADEITTMSLIPRLVDELKIPVIAAGGIADGRGILSALSLGAEGVQIGTLFAASEESSAHLNYKQKIIEAGECSTTLAFKKIGLLRMLKNEFALKAVSAELEGWDENKMIELLGRKRERLGIFEGDELEGALEAGQGVGLIDQILPAEKIISNLIGQYQSALNRINSLQKG